MLAPFDGELSTKDAIARELLAEAGARSGAAARDRDDSSEGPPDFDSAACTVDVEILTGGAE